MKRILALALLAGVVVSAAPSSAAPGVGEGFYADANWFLETRNPKVLRWYTASVQGEARSAQESFAFIGRGRCRVMRNGLGCVASEIAYARNKDVLQIDPAMQTAELAMKDRKGKLHTVSWEAKMSVPWVWELQEQCSTGAAAAVFVVRPATAVAEIGGRSFTEPALWDGYDGTELSRFFGASACAADRSPEPGTELRRTFHLR